MKSTTTATAAYESPKIKVIEIDIQELICVSNPEKYSTEMEYGDDNW